MIMYGLVVSGACHLHYFAILRALRYFFFKLLFYFGTNFSQTVSEHRSRYFIAHLYTGFKQGLNKRLVMIQQVLYLYIYHLVPFIIVSYFSINCTYIVLHLDFSLLYFGLVAHCPCISLFSYL